jgi:hypothetical protein
MSYTTWSILKWIFENEHKLVLFRALEYEEDLCDMISDRKTHEVLTNGKYFPAAESIHTVWAVRRSSDFLTGGCMLFFKL